MDDRNEGLAAGLLRLGLRPASAAADLAGRGLVAAVDAALEWRYTEEAVEHVLESPVLEQVLESGLLDRVIERLLETDELWVLVEEVAGSPAVTDAIGQQSLGFADQVAGRVRTSSQRADDTVERVARRVLRRKDG